MCAVLLVFLFLARDRKPGKRDGLNWMCSTGRQMLRCMLLRRGMLGNRYGTKVKKRGRTVGQEDVDDRPKAEDRKPPPSFSLMAPSVCFF